MPRFSHRQKRRRACFFIFAVSILLGISTPSSAAPRLSFRVKRVKGITVALEVRLKTRKRKKRRRATLSVAFNQSDFAEFSSVEIDRSGQTLFIDILRTGRYRFRAAIPGRAKRGKYTRTRTLQATEGDGASPISQSLFVVHQPEPETPEPTSELSSCSSEYGNRILGLVNEARREAGLRQVIQKVELTNAAELHSRWMASNEILSHDGWFDRVIQSGSTGSYFNQNIAAGRISPERAMELWMGSASHSSNILSDRVRHLGVACIIGKNGLWYWTQMFSN